MTKKVLANLEDRLPVPPQIEAKNRPLVESAIKTAGWAPFHYPRGVHGIAEPWRAHVLWNEATWIPEEAPASLGQAEDSAVIRNEEHLAATSAMVQNLLLALTEKDIGTYWSSGGKLRGSEVFDSLGIPQPERLLAAVFLEYPEMRNSKYGNTSRKPGALRNKRSLDWLREISESSLA